jgi:Putative zinc-finger
MTHLELENLLADYLDGTLEAEGVTAAEAHLNSCSACRETTESVRFAISRCRAAQDLEPAPWLVSRILDGTIGERKLSLIGQLTASLRLILRPQVTYGVSMAVFSLSFILFIAKANLRGLNVRQLNPAMWVERVNSRGHLFVARVEKFYYDIRFVYEVQSVLRELRQQPHPRPAKPGNRSGGTSRARPRDEERLVLRGNWPAFRSAPSLQGSRLARIPRSLPT